jgi:hypothetical protein
LNEQSRQLFILSDIEGYTHDELAEMFKLPKGTVSSKIYRTRAKLSKMLERYAVKHGFIQEAQVEKEREAMHEAMAMCPDRARMESEAMSSLPQVKEEMK